jgi:Tol biopolymer transport system component
MDPRLSPDGKKLAVSYGDPNREIWVFDLERGTQTRLTFTQSNAGSGAKIQPAWSPDGKFIAYTMSLIGGGAVSTSNVKAANGSGTEKPLVDVGKTVTGTSTVYPSWSPDGKYIAYILRTGPTGQSVYVKPTAGGDAFVALPAASAQSNISYFRISPNGRWIAYASNESGRDEIYVAPFPRGDGKWQVSTSGALTVAWRGDSKELFYSTVPGDYVAVDVTEDKDELRFGTSHKLFAANASATGTDFDVAADGKRLLVNTSSDNGVTSPLFLVTNWEAELKKK